MCSAIRAPNALRESDYFQLHKYGAPKFRSVSASCAAALFRTALATVTSWPKWIRQLEACASECLPLELCGKGITTPAYWDSDPMALNLKNAYNGFPNCAKWAEGGALLINKLLAQNSNRPTLPGDEFVVKEKSGLQKLTYDELTLL